jgi:hypothetical protein
MILPDVEGNGLLLARRQGCLGGADEKEQRRGLEQFADEIAEWRLFGADEFGAISGVQHGASFRWFGSEWVGVHIQRRLNDKFSGTGTASPGNQETSFPSCFIAPELCDASIDILEGKSSVSI